MNSTHKLITSTKTQALQLKATLEQDLAALQEEACRYFDTLHERVEAEGVETVAAHQEELSARLEAAEVDLVDTQVLLAFLDSF